MKWTGQHIYDYVATFRQGVTMDSTLSVAGNLTFDSVTLTGIQTSSESFVDNDISLMTSAAIADKIESYGYSTASGDITSVTITTDSGSGSKASETSGSADFSILGANGVGVTNSGTTITAAAVPGEIDHDSLLNFASNEHFTQANITTVGTIDTGVWNGTSIGTTYTDAKVTSIVAGDGIDVSGATGDVTVTAETATDSNPGVVELATTGEADTGTDTARAVTPAGLKSHVDDRHTYVYLHIHGRSSTGNDNWFFQDGTNDGEFNWETDGGADAFADDTYTDVGNSTVSLGRDIGVMGFVVPYDCTLIGFKAIGRDLNGNDEFKAGLWSSPVFSGYGGSTGTTTFTLRAVATASTSGGSGGSFNGICKLDDLTRSYSLSAGQIILPSLAETDVSRTYLSMTIVLKVPII